MLEIKLADQFVDKCLAWNLVHHQYVKRGLASSHPSRLLFSSLDLLPTSLTAVARFKDKVIGTMSAVISPLGALPSGLTFEDDLKDFGIDGRVICEFTKLAVEDSVAHSKEQIPLLLMAYLLRCCFLHSVDDAFCVVHPRHAATWVRLFDWMPISVVRQCSHVNKAPGVLLHIDLHRLFSGQSKINPRGRQLLEQASHFAKAGEPALYRPSGSEFAMLFLQRPELVQETTIDQRSLLKRFYPWASGFIEDFIRTVNHPWRPMRLQDKPKPFREHRFPFARQVRQNQAPSAVGSTDLRFLVVARDPQSRRYLSLLLQRAKHQCFLAEDLIRASDSIRRMTFDVILLFNAEEEDLWGEAFGDVVRAQDCQRRIHTPILSLNRYLASSRSTLPYITAVRGVSQQRFTEASLGSASQWAFEHPMPALMLRALEVLGGESPRKDYASFRRALAIWPRNDADEARYRATAG